MHLILMKSEAVALILLFIMPASVMWLICCVSAASEGGNLAVL